MKLNLITKLIKKIPIINRFDKLFWSYLFISVIATIVDVLFLFLLTDVVKINYLVSGTISFFFGTVVAYIGQKYFTFKDKNKRVARQFGLFAFISVIGLLINLGVLKICVDVLGLHYMIGKVFAIGIGFIWNYTANRKITFKKNNPI